MDTTHFSGFILQNFRHFTTPQPWGLFLSYFYSEKSRSNVCEKCWLTTDCNGGEREIMLFIGKPKGRSKMISNSGGCMNPLNSPRNEYCKTELGKKNSEEKFGESGSFCGSKFDPATGVQHFICRQMSYRCCTILTSIVQIP